MNCLCCDSRMRSYRALRQTGMYRHMIMSLGPAVLAASLMALILSWSEPSHPAKAHQPRIVTTGIHQSNQSTTLNKMFQHMAICLGTFILVVLLTVMCLGWRKSIEFVIDSSMYIWKTLSWTKSSHPAKAQPPLSNSQPLHPPSTMPGAPSSLSGLQKLSTPAKPHLPASNSVHHSPHPSPPGSTSGAQNPSLQNLWMMFGVGSYDETIKIEEIRLLSQTNDRVFFRELKKRYVKNRWLLQRWLSPLRFRNSRITQASL
jgi:hypothetical protein